MPGFALVLLSLGLMLFRIVSPRGARVEGKLLRTVTLTLRERLTLQRTNMLCLGGILLLGALGHWISLPFELLAIVASYGVLMVPVRYQVTTQGIALNRVVFRRWTEFDEVEVSPQRIVLLGHPGNGRLTLWLRESHQREVLSLLRRHVPDRRGSSPSTEEKEGGMNAATMFYRRLLPRRS